MAKRVDGHALANLHEFANLSEALVEQVLVPGATVRLDEDGIVSRAVVLTVKLELERNKGRPPTSEPGHARRKQRRATHFTNILKGPPGAKPREDLKLAHDAPTPTVTPRTRTAAPPPSDHCSAAACDGGA